MSGRTVGRIRSWSCASGLRLWRLRPPESALAQVMTRSFAGKIRFWSRGMERLYGFTAAEAMGRYRIELLHTEFPHSFEMWTRTAR